MRTSTILIFLGACVWAYFEVSHLWVAVNGAITTEGVIDRFEKRVEYSSSTGRSGKVGEWIDYAIYVTFTTIDEEVVTRPVQNGGSGPKDIYFDEDILFTANFEMEQGAKVPLLYHPELGDLIWFDDFWMTWIFPLFITLVASIPLLAILGLVIFVILSSFLERKQDLETAVHRKR